MTKQRYKYAILILLIIIIGLLSRKMAVIPAATGDALYAVMMYFIVRFCLLNAKIRTVTLISIAICFAIECSQAYHASWIDAVRRTLPGRLILGQGFLWTDLLAYVIGALCACLLDAFTKRAK